MRAAAALLSLALSAFVVGSCGASNGAVGVEQTPIVAGAVVTEGATTTLPDPRRRYPEGSRIVRIAADGTRTVLSDGLVAAGAPFVHHEGQKLLFVGRETTDSPFEVYECAADGTSRRVVVAHGTDCVRAAYLPDGRVVYAADLPETSPMAGVESAAALFVAAGDGTPGERISFGAGLDTDPTVLTDGRVLFASWRPDSDGAGRLGLFTVHPDGTGYAPFHLADGPACYPKQQPDLDVRFALRQDDGPELEFVADWDAPMTSSHVADEQRGETVSLVPRPRPQGHLSSLQPDRPYGTLICVDARATGASAASSYQIATWSGERQVLGRAPLAEDGSFMVQVPPDTPIVIQLLDESNRLVSEEHGPIWVRRNEARVCVTCHDDIEQSPPNRRPMAVLEEPVDMTEVAK